MTDVTVECRGGLVPLPPGCRDWLPLVFESRDEASRAAGAEVVVHYADALDLEWIHPMPGQAWARIPLTRAREPVAIRLPDLPRMRVRLGWPG